MKLEKLFTAIALLVAGAVSAGIAYKFLASYSFDHGVGVGTIKALVILLSIGFTLATWFGSYNFFRMWQFDVELKEMETEFKKSTAGLIRIPCSCQKLAEEFWRHHKSTIAGREKWDPDIRLFIARKIG